MTEPPRDRPPDGPDDRPPYRRWSWRVWAFGAIALLWAVIAAVSSHQRGLAIAFAVVGALLAVNAARRPTP